MKDDLEFRVQDFVHHEKSQSRAELLRRIMDGAALIRNNHEILRKATRAVLKQARLCVANARDHFEQRATRYVCYVTTCVEHE
jgi:hypothetical protein